jgi:hypothetical protein
MTYNATVVGTVLASIAVYAAAAGLALWAAGRWVLRMRRRVALALAVLPLLFIGRALATGRVFAPLDIVFSGDPFAPLRSEYGIPARARTPLLSDVVSSMIPWHQAVRESVADGRLPLWNRFVLAGEPLLAVQQHAALHPGSWFALLLPAPQAWTFLMALRLLIALLAAYLFLRDAGCDEAPALLGAAGWGFSDMLVFSLGYPVTTSLGPFPLLLLGLGRLVRDADRRSVALTTAALVLIITGGHPESLLFCVAGGGVYFLFALGAGGRGRRLRPLLLSFVAGVVALGLTAVQLGPLAEALPQTWEHVFRHGWYAHIDKSASLADSARRGLTVLLPFAYGESGAMRTWRDFGTPGLYAGSLLFPLALVGLGERGWRRGALLVVGLLGAALWARLAIVMDAVAALPLFDIAILEYLSFLGIFALAAFAAFGAQRLSRGEGAPVFWIGCALSAAAIVGIFAFRRDGLVNLGMQPEFARARLFWELAPLMLGALVAALGLAGRRPGRLRLVAAALLGLLLCARVAEAGSVYPTYSVSAFYPPLPALDAVPRDAPFRFAALGFFFVPNAAVMYGIEDVRGYESMSLRSFRQTFPLWCVDQGVWFNRIDDLTRPFLAFLNVRYALVPPGLTVPPGWTRIASGPSADLLENPAALPRAFAPELLLEEPDLESRLEALGGISDFSRRGVVGSRSRAAAGWVPNGRATVTVSEYRPQSMTLDIMAEEESVIGTSIPEWRGWQARLDGKRIERLSYNHAFLGYRVPPGRHRLTLRYLPAGFTAGAAVTLATLLALAVAGFRVRLSSRVR